MHGQNAESFSEQEDRQGAKRGGPEVGRCHGGKQKRVRRGQGTEAGTREGAGSSRSPDTGTEQTFPPGSSILVEKDLAPLSFGISRYLFLLAVDLGKWLGEVRFSLPNRQWGRKGPEALSPAHLHFKQPVCFIS